MQRPKKVQIMWMNYPIEWKKEVLWDKDSEITRCHGTIRYREKIEVQTGQHPDATRQSLLHEMVHGWIHHFIDKNGLHEHEEEHVEMMANAIQDSLQQNPKLWMWLLERT